jgi:hypothetical protein
MWRLQVDEVTKTGVDFHKSCPPPEALTLKVKKKITKYMPLGHWLFRMPPKAAQCFFIETVFPSWWEKKILMTEDCNTRDSMAQKQVRKIGHWVSTSVLLLES